MVVEYSERLGKSNDVLCPEGVRKGDRVSIYMPMVVELVVAMLACARIGAVHSIVVCSSCSLFFRDQFIACYSN